MLKEVADGMNKTVLDFEIGMALLFANDYASAYLIFMSLSKNEDVAIKFNLALCLIKAQEYEKALLQLEDALLIINTCSGFKYQPNKIYQYLLKQSEERYLVPMLQKVPQILPVLAKENIIRLMIDLFIKCDLPDRVLSLSVGYGHFENVKNAVAFVKNRK